MRKLTYAEAIFARELAPMQEMVKQRRREKRHAKVNWSYSEQKRVACTTYCRSSLLYLIQAGISYEEAKEMLDTL